jgi:hypothetical protein
VSYRKDIGTTKSLVGCTQCAWLEQILQVPVRTRLLMASIQVLPVDYMWDDWNLFLHRNACFILSKDPRVLFEKGMAWLMLLLAFDG